MKAQVEHAGHEARNESQTPEGAPEFALLLKRLRARAGLSQEELADRARVSVQAVSALERGYRKVPYQNTVERLAEALALPPDARNRFEAAAAEARAMRFRTSRLISPTHNLPAQLTSFLGRDEVVSEIASLMERSRLVSMVGTGGVGKTRTAIEVARTLIEERTGGVWFVDLASLTDPSLIGSEIAAVLGLKEARHNPFDAALTFLAEKHVLLLLDNCEHVVEEVRAAARAMLSVCPHVTILTTSREPIALQGEHVYRIPPLAVPNDVTSAAEALRYGAVALFVDRAMAADARFLLDDENAPAVAEVCRRLDGLPLAIEIVAARSTVLSPRQLLLRLHRTFELLSGGQSPIPRQHTMRSVIDWSYGLLSAQARLLFERLSVFNGGFTLDAALDVCVGDGLEADDIFGLLASLVDKSLVVADFSQGDARYHILELTRAYAAEKLESRGQRELVARRHASAYAGIALRLEREWYTREESAWHSETDCELDNYRAALEWSLRARNDVSAGQELVAALAPMWYSNAASEGQRWVALALAAVHADTPTLTVARLHIAEAKLYGALGQYKASLEAAERGILLLREGSDPLEWARAAQTAGSALGALGRTDEGERLLHEAAQTARALGNARLTAMALTDLGTARSRYGDVAGARDYYAQALGIYSSLRLRRPAASVAGHLAELEFAAGDAEAAFHTAAEALEGHNAARNRRSAAVDLCNMAAYLVALDAFEEARVYALQALTLAREVQATVLTMFILQHLAAVLALRASGGGRSAGRDRIAAARLLAFIDRQLDELEARREYTERQEYERVRTALQVALGPERFERLSRGGLMWDEERAVAQAVGP